MYINLHNISTLVNRTLFTAVQFKISNENPQSLRVQVAAIQRSMLIQLIHAKLKIVFHLPLHRIQ